MAFLPITREELQALAWERPDIVLVSGDAYVDHPSFGTAIVSRVLTDAGFRVGIIPQPQSKEDLLRLGIPRLAFFINGGNIDSMVNHYTVAKRLRDYDYYSPGGKTGRRPDRAVICYCRWARSVAPKVPIAIGGVEASLRRFAHYDYWDNTVHPSILLESGADLLMYGMGEKQVVEIAKRLSEGAHVSDLNAIRGTCVLKNQEDLPLSDVIFCPSLEDVKPQTDRGFQNYAIACRIQQEEHDAIRGKTLIQKHGNRFVVQNPPMPPLTQQELDRVYELPYERNYHPSYEAEGGVPAIEEVKFSITHNRGCFGACNFCSIAYHQGRFVTSRSKESILREAENLTEIPDFKGYIHDVGGPTANFRSPSCEKQRSAGLCKNRKCLAPTPCRQLKVDHSEYLDILKEVRRLPKVKKVFIRSGIRFDYLVYDSDDTFFKDLVRYHVSGQLKVAPEHCSAGVLSAMGKPDFSVYLKFKKRFYELTKSFGLKQYLVPYLMSSHPGSTVRDAVELSLFLKKENLRPEQVQDFYPTPGTVSTCMFYTGLDPFTLKKVYVAKSKEEKATQRALLQYYKPENKARIEKALMEIGRQDLIGYGAMALISPEHKVEKKAFSRDKHPEKAFPQKRKTSLTKHLKRKNR